MQMVNPKVVGSRNGITDILFNLALIADHQIYVFSKGIFLDIIFVA